MAKPRQPKDDLKKLQKIWYAKLKKSGFEDAEDINGNLISYHSSLFNKPSERYKNGGMLVKQEYYYQVEHFLNAYKFQSKLDRIIWEYHTNAISVRDIVKLLAKVRIKTNFSKVLTVIKKLQSVMRRNSYE